MKSTRGAVSTELRFSGSLLALSGLNLSPEKATIERGHKMALESNLASRLVFHWTGRAFTLAL
jgi:hypothetical protein